MGSRDRYRPRGHTVYRATTPEGAWTVVTGSNSISTTTWTATGLANDYWFAVSSADITGNRSAKSPAATATPRAPDTTAPECTHRPHRGAR